MRMSCDLYHVTRDARKVLESLIRFGSVAMVTGDVWEGRLPIR